MPPEEAAAVEQLLIRVTGGHGWGAADVLRLQPPAGIVLADRRREICIALVSVAADEAELLDIGVRDDAQGQGIGSDLLAGAEAASRSLGARRMTLEVAVDNDRARALYRSAGYGEVGRRRDYYRRGEGSRVDALILAKRLTTDR